MVSYSAIENCEINANSFQPAARKLTDVSALRLWNDEGIQLERHLLLSDGLPHRPWYKHVIFGPGFNEGSLSPALWTVRRSTTMLPRSKFT
ncbi:hypothetical protein P3T76_004723 [Phytophthora citrophthora]|uniref:Transferrin receptor-like dimerisation domain-containing protein n=1 Tax=Phytophthora citrophthora TaxID=4793 RepID=A0AAD9LQ44_9STRA|nr:hypothetical protein P3T76_004723 [Phytophthora citrophthora]